MGATNDPGTLNIRQFDTASIMKQRTTASLKVSTVYYDKGIISMIIAGYVRSALCAFFSCACIAFLSEATLTLAQDTCGSIGNSNENAQSVERGQSFYLNTAKPAPCTGNITSWRVCYYGPSEELDSDDRFSYWATYAVYRKMNSGANGRYERVSQLFSAVTATNNLVQIDNTGRTDGEIQQQGFNCYDDSVTVPLTVQAGDVLGACVFNPTDGFFFTRIQLDIVGQVDGESLLQMGTGECTTTALPTSIQASQLSTVDSRRLHLYANIGIKDLVHHVMLLHHECIE